MRIRGANEEQNEYPAHVNYPTPHHIPTRPMETSSSNGPISAANEFMNEHPSGIQPRPISRRTAEAYRPPGRTPHRMCCCPKTATPAR